MVSFTNWTKIQDKFFINGAFITSLPDYLPLKFNYDLSDCRPLRVVFICKNFLYLKPDAIILK